MAEKLAAFCASNILARATRESCVAKMQSVQIPQKYKEKSSKTAAVLIPVCDLNGTVSILYTVRSSNLNKYSSQVAFPGGKMDTGETPIQTALRETQEEIGLNPSKIDVWGHGSPIPGKDRVMITPVVGNIKEIKEEDLNINPKEVSDVFTIPIEELSNPKNQYYTQFTNGYMLPVFVAKQYRIWGVTAYITHTFLSCLLPKDAYMNEWTKNRVALQKSMEMEKNEA